MEHHTASTTPIPCFGEDWFDPLAEEEAQAALGGRQRYRRNCRLKGHRIKDLGRCRARQFVQHVSDVTGHSPVPAIGRTLPAIQSKINGEPLFRPG